MSTRELAPLKCPDCGPTNLFMDECVLNLPVPANEETRNLYRDFVLAFREFPYALYRKPFQRLMVALIPDYPSVSGAFRGLAEQAGRQTNLDTERHWAEVVDVLGMINETLGSPRNAWVIEACCPITDCQLPLNKRVDNFTAVLCMRARAPYKLLLPSPEIEILRDPFDQNAIDEILSDYSLILRGDDIAPEMFMGIGLERDDEQSM